MMNKHNQDLDAENRVDMEEGDDPNQPDVVDHATTGGAATAGAATGAVIGLSGGPLGIAAGAAAGAAIGAAVERVMHGATGHDDAERAAEDRTRDHPSLTWGDVSAQFRDEYEQWHGPSGRAWEEAEPGYRYGYEMAHDTRFDGMEWPDAEEHLHTYYNEWGEVQGYAEDPADWAIRREDAYEAWSLVRGGGFPYN